MTSNDKLNSLQSIYIIISEISPESFKSIDGSGFSF